MKNFFIGEIVKNLKPATDNYRINNSFDLLAENNIYFEWIGHDAAESMEYCRKIEKNLGVTICKNLLLCNRQETKFFLLVIFGDKKFLTKDLSNQINSSRLSFAKPKHMEMLLDTLPGSLSILGLQNDISKEVTLLIDEDILKENYFGMHPCDNTISLKISTQDLFKTLIPKLNHEAIFVNIT